MKKLILSLLAPFLFFSCTNKGYQEYSRHEEFEKDIIQSLSNAGYISEFSAHQHLATGAIKESHFKIRIQDKDGDYYDLVNPKAIDGSFYLKNRKTKKVVKILSSKSPDFQSYESVAHERDSLATELASFKVAKTDSLSKVFIDNLDKATSYELSIHAKSTNLSNDELYQVAKKIRELTKQNRHGVYYRNESSYDGGGENYLYSAIKNILDNPKSNSRVFGLFKDYDAVLKEADTYHAIHSIIGIDRHIGKDASEKYLKATEKEKALLIN